MIAIASIYLMKNSGYRATTHIAHHAHFELRYLADKRRVFTGEPVRSADGDIDGLPTRTNLIELPIDKKIAGIVHRARMRYLKCVR